VTNATRAMSNPSLDGLGRDDIEMSHRPRPG
jgi:hypothetical protein